MKYHLSIKITVLTMLILCIISLSILGYSGHQQNKVCWPTIYPSKDIFHLDEGQININSTNDAIEDIIRFYDEQLGAITLPSINDSSRWENHLWTRVQLDDSSYVYMCYATEIYNAYAYQGCIYISSNQRGSLIKTALYRIWDDTDDCAILIK